MEDAVRAPTDFEYFARDFKILTRKRNREDLHEKGLTILQYDRICGYYFLALAAMRSYLFLRKTDPFTRSTQRFFLRRAKAYARKAVRAARKRKREWPVVFCDMYRNALIIILLTERRRWRGPGKYARALLAANRLDYEEVYGLVNA